MRRDAGPQAAEALRDAYLSDDPIALGHLLSPGVRVVVDSGGVAGRAHGPADGVTAAVTLLRVALGATEGLVLDVRSVNGRPGLRASRGGHVVAVVAVDGERGRIERVWLVTNPGKLGGWA